jgi:hypothetical protein
MVALPFTIQQLLAAAATLLAAVVLARRLFGRKLPPGPAWSFPFLGASSAHSRMHDPSAAQELLEHSDCLSACLSQGNTGRRPQQRPAKRTADPCAETHLGHG